MLNLFDVIKNIEPIDNNKYLSAQNRWDSIAKPLKSMGEFENIISTIVAINSGNIDKRCVAVMCADNGIVAQNVTQTDSSVTKIVAENIINHKASVCNIAKICNTDVFAYDVGMNTDSQIVPNYKYMNGTNDFSKINSIPRDIVIKTIETGIKIVGELKEKGYNLIATGEMGIGNTTTSSAITSVILNLPVSEVTGKGAGLSDSGLLHKINIITAAIKKHSPFDDVIDILSKVGGLDICAMCGVFLGGAYYKTPVIMDGFISAVSAMCAYNLCNNVNRYIIPSHLSKEKAMKLITDKLNITPVIFANMALGEGAGAVSVIPLLDMALSIYKNMPTFKDIKIEEYIPL